MIYRTRPSASGALGPLPEQAGTGFRHFNVCRGRPFSSAATLSSLIDPVAGHMAHPRRGERPHRQADGRWKPLACLPLSGQRTL